MCGWIWNGSSRIFESIKPHFVRYILVNVNFFFRNLEWNFARVFASKSAEHSIQLFLAQKKPFHLFATSKHFCSCKFSFKKFIKSILRVSYFDDCLNPLVSAMKNCTNRVAGRDIEIGKSAFLHGLKYACQNGGERLLGTTISFKLFQIFHSFLDVKNSATTHLSVERAQRNVLKPVPRNTSIPSWKNGNNIPSTTLIIASKLNISSTVLYLA